MSTDPRIALYEAAADASLAREEASRTPAALVVPLLLALMLAYCLAVIYAFEGAWPWEDVP